MGHVFLPCSICLPQRTGQLWFQQCRRTKIFERVQVCIFKASDHSPSTSRSQLPVNDQLFRSADHTSSTPVFLAHHLNPVSLHMILLLPLISSQSCSAHPSTSPFLPSLHHFLSAESSAATTATAPIPVWSPWGDLSSCCSGQMPLNHKLSL